MRVTKKIEVGALSVEARELLTSDIRALLSAKPEGEIDVVAEMLFEDVAFSDIYAATDLTKEQLDTLTPSEIRKVAEAVKEMNPDFFAMRARLRATVQRIAQQPQSAA